MSAYASVIIPTHNRHSTLSSAVASIQAQTVEAVEILIVGDGATPSVAQIARSIADQDSRVRFLDLVKEHADGGPNIHRGVQAASSERIFYCDDDDVWLPQHVATLAPQLDRCDIADTMPVSVGSIPVGGQRRLHGTLVNSGAAHIRSQLAERKLKLTFDTHVAHRRSSYFRLGAPWIAASGPSVTHMLGAFARSEHIRWNSLPIPTALSLHGAARLLDSESARRGEIELWLRRIKPMSPAALGLDLNFCWHFTRTLWEDSPSGQSLQAYLARAGIAWEVRTGDIKADLLDVPLTQAQRRSIEIAYYLFQGHPREPVDGFPEMLLALLDNVLGAYIPVEFAMRLLRPFGPDRAINIVRTMSLQEPQSKHLADLLLGYCLCEAGKPAEARKLAKCLAEDARLPQYDLTRLMVRIDMAEAAPDAAISRLECAFRESRTATVAGLELASTLLALGRPLQAREVCRELEPLLPGSEWLEALRSHAESACVGR